MNSLFSIFLLSLLLGLSPSVFAVEETGTQHAKHQSHSDASASAEMLVLGEDSPASFKYVCPMHPQIIRDHEGSCPICGMDLVKHSFEASAKSVQISVGQASVNGLKQGLAIRTATVQKTTLWQYIPTFGKVVADETKVIHIHPRTAGWISDLSVRSSGEAVTKGQLLYRLYSPEMVSAQQDFILALQNRQRLGKSANSLVNSAKVRLELLGISDKVIKQIKKTKEPINKIPIYASQNGVVSNLVVQDGMYIQPHTQLMSLSDLSSVWVEAEVLPLQQAWIKKGITADIKSSAFPEKRWESQIEYIYPVTEMSTQALKVRLPVVNESHTLKPHMFMDVELYGGPKHQTLAIPLEAVISDGRSKRVVTQIENGLFEVVEVVTGIETKGIVEILSGLTEGQSIVLSGQFLIDSESQIQTNLRRLITTVDHSNH